ncbi:hypothetical protein FKB34_13475 [Glycocaulis profundi]|nr:hypothetical protein FKB34_13475 [Glycocaulis profundi]
MRAAHGQRDQKREPGGEPDEAEHEPSPLPPAGRSSGADSQPARRLARRAGPRWLTAGHLGSVTGARVATLYRHWPYGEPESWSGSRFRCAGQIALPEAALYHYKARVYDPYLGRFLQTDHIGYEYQIQRRICGGQPPIRITPSGVGRCSMRDFQ